MHSLHRFGAFGLVGTLFLAVSALAAPELSSSAETNGYQLRRLLNPTPAELAAETKGQVYVYDNLYAHEVQEALETQFRRIDSMMFTRIRYPDPGTPEGYAVEEDGCD